jgi:acetyl-CoA carboxylase biotin carboxyl carrier protein
VSLTAADVAEILRLLEQSSFDELNLEMNGMKLSLRRGAAAGSGSEEAFNRRAAESAGARDGGSGAGAAGGAGGSSSAAGAAAGGARDGAGSSTRATAPSAANHGANQNAAPNQAASYAAPAKSSDPNIHDVPSPLLGTFYRSPKPGAPPFVEVGATVSEETIVAIIEVMKLMNTVRAGARGTVTEIIPADGTLVEYDQPLLRIRKAG